MKVWQKSYAFCRGVYRVTKAFPADERFGLVAQLRRASISIPSNIAEGYSRETTPDYLRFLWLAKGSLAEVETQLMLARDLELAPDADYGVLFDDLHEIERMLAALIRSLKTRAVALDETSDSP